MFFSGKLRLFSLKFPVISYCLLAFSITWGLKLLYTFYKSRYGLPVFNFSLIASFGPSIAALLLLYISEGTNGFKPIFRSVLNWRIGIGWILLASFFEPVIFWSITLAYGLAYNGFPLPQSISVIMEIASYIGTFALGLFRWGLAEEIGWRGWLLPKLQYRLAPLPASLILALIASLWHINPATISDVAVSKESAYLYVFCPEIVERLLISIPITMVITWIFNKTGGNLLLAILFHSASNTSYFWIDEVFGIVKTDFFRMSFSVALVIVAIVFTTLLLHRHKKVVSLE